MQNIPFDIEALRRWFLAAKRPLPWREASDPYAVWVSEVMLQQTQVAVVEAYYKKWLSRFPTVVALAQAPLEEVIKMWEGLGYYSRARHLHQAAQHLVKEHGGCLPQDREALAKVKGLGPYTIGAILSFAFRQKAAAVDGNAIRVLARYFAIDGDVSQGKTIKLLWAIAEAILPEQQPWEIVEGLIELGAILCKKVPLCHLCPLQHSCQAKQQGIEGSLPKKGKKIPLSVVTRHVFVIVFEKMLLVKKGARGALMADLYEFPYTEWGEAMPPLSLSLQKIASLSQVTHCFTRYKALLFPSLWRALEQPSVQGYEWIDSQEIGQLPFSAGHRKILQEVLCQSQKNTDIV